MCPSGFETAGIMIMKVRRPTDRRGPVLTADGRCCAAVTGTPQRGGCAPRRVAGGPLLNFFFLLLECELHGHFDPTRSPA